MAIRHPHTSISQLKKRRKQRLQKQRRETGREMQLERLEDRRLLANAPQLIGIQPNVGELLSDGDIRSTAPRELVFQFSEGSQLDPATFSGIQLTRSGLDGTFETASVSSDFNTNGAVVLRFTALKAGQAGDGLSLLVSRSDQGIGTAPKVNVTDRTIRIELNSNSFTPTTAQGLITALQNHTVARTLVSASVASGFGATPIGNRAVNYSPLVLTGANAAKVTASFNTNSPLRVQLTAVAPGLDGNAIQVRFTKSDHGGIDDPTIRVEGTTIHVDLNTHAGRETTAANLITTLNNHAQASQLVRASLVAGIGTTNIASPTINYSPLRLAGANDIAIKPGFIGMGNNQREVVMRFNETLPDDHYRIDVLGAGSQALRNVSGAAFNEGRSVSVNFQLDLGAQVQAIVPQPVTRVRQPNGTFKLNQARDQIIVYFNDDDLHGSDVQTQNLPTDPTVVNPAFYQLLFTNESVENTDDVVFRPSSIKYSPSTDMAVLTFDKALDELVDPATNQPVGPGTFRLRIGTDEAQPSAPVQVTPAADPGSSFTTAFDVTTNFTNQSVVLSSMIDAQQFALDLPGAVDEPGHRDIDVDNEQHLSPILTPDAFDGITTIFYNFQDIYGFDPAGNPLRNLITPTQKDRAREIFELYSNYLGIDFVETADLGLTVATGDMRAIIPNVATGPGGIHLSTLFDPTFRNGMLVMDNAESWDDKFGDTTNPNNPSWFRNAMAGVGQMLGLDGANDLPRLTSLALQPNPDFPDSISAEPIFPGDHDITHGQHLFRPESKDIDLYRFQLSEGGTFSAETIAERLPNSSLLDTTLTLYQEKRDISGNLLGYVLVARNDDYFSEDSFLKLDLEAGTYFIGISASGNNQYDPTIEDSGFGGTSQGEYELRLDFRAEADRTIVDIDNPGEPATLLDGDADGVPGGVHNSWFRAAAPLDPAKPNVPRTIFVDKASTAANPNGSLDRPFTTISAAMDRANPNDIVRIVGNGGADGDISTSADNLAYELGFSRAQGQPLADGATLEVKRGVTVVIDSGAIVKLRRARIGVGSSSPTVDRGTGALQVLGTPRLIGANGGVVKDAAGRVIAGNVFFTSIHDASLGIDTNPDNAPPAAAPGDWGGLAFRNDLDRADAKRRLANRRDYEEEGLFLNTVNYADIRYGGGAVSVNGVTQVINPIHMTDARPTITYNTISRSADAAMSANPNSFEETTFHAPAFQGVPFTSDYDRVGPEIHHNTVIDNSINGLFVRIKTPAGNDLQPMTVSGRWDDTDIVHVVTENLLVQGTPGGPLRDTRLPQVQLVTLTPQAGGSLAAGTYNYKVVFVNAEGGTSLPSKATANVTVSAAQGRVRLNNLPVATGEFIRRRIYRSDAATGGAYTLIAELNAVDLSYVDNGTTIGGTLAVLPVSAVTLTAQAGGALASGTYNYRITLIDAAGKESPASDATANVVVTGGNGQVELQNLPPATGDFVGRRIYRSVGDGSGRYQLVEQINAGDTSYTDVGLTQDIFLDDSILRARQDARLAIDPGTIVKLDGARFEVGMSAQMLAEGVRGRQVTFTSLEDTTQGAGGTFNTRQGTQDNGSSNPQPGDWSGIFAGHISSLSLDHVHVAFAGGVGRVEGNFAGFNPVEIHQATARVTHSTFTNNANGLGGQAPTHRFGRGANAAGSIFVRGAQPIIVDNVIRRSGGAAINIDANSLNHLQVTDPGRSTGNADRIARYAANQGPLVRENQLDVAEINAMVVRGGTLTTEGVWDDTDIVHVVRETVVVPDFHTFGGLRLESSSTESLVVKLEGDSAGFTATGRPLDIDDRIGGSVRVAGQPQSPVVLTSVHDCTVGAGFTPNGQPQNDTLNSGACGVQEVETPYVDVVVVMDESASMGFAQQFSVGLIADLDQALNAVGIGSGSSGPNRFGLAGYGGSSFGSAPHEDGHAHPVGANGALFGTSTEYATAAQSLVTNGAIEDGFEALHFTMDTYTFRPEAEKFVILVTNEDRDIVDGSKTFANTLARLNAGGVKMQGIVAASFVDGNGARALALDSLGNAFLGDGQGGFTRSPGGRVQFASGSTQTDYIDMAFATGGIVGDIFQIQQGGVTATSFSRAMVTSIVSQAGGGVGAAAGDWRSVKLDQFSNDRNVETAIEREPGDVLSGVDSNQNPDSAQLLGSLAPNEKSGDDNRRLGFDVHGLVNQPSDVDVYSFNADAGTEVWLDLDRTSHSLDSVIELIDANGSVIARSTSSAAEAVDPTKLFRSNDIPAHHVNPLQKSIHEPQDRWSTNPRDAGMRLVLPGSPGTTNTYYVRVRSNSPNLNNLKGGETSGNYQLQVRLREIDEIAGSSVQHADIRYATNGVEVIGLPGHSPLLGEAGETSANNNTQGNAQQLGNLLNSDRATLSVSGNINTSTDVDFYEFQIEYDAIQPPLTPRHLATMFDIDYADGLARADTTISVFDSTGRLILTSRNSNVGDDRPAALTGAGMSDLSRGTVGPLDPYIGTTELLEGTYYVAVSSNGQIPQELEQYLTRNPSNPLLRLEPVNSVRRIAEDRIGFSGGSNITNPPQLPVLVDSDSAVPFHLGDVTLFVSQGFGLVGGTRSTVRTVNPFTGSRVTTLGSFGPQSGDIAMRADGSLFTFSTGPATGVQTDANVGNYLQIDTGTAAANSLGDDGINTFFRDGQGNINKPNNNNGLGVEFNAISFLGTSQFSGFAVGNRGDGANPNGVGFGNNILYNFDIFNGAARSFGDVRGGNDRVLGAGTDIVERGQITTDQDAIGGGNTVLVTSEATEVAGGVTTPLINDGTLFVVDRGNGQLITFEFDTGPQVNFTIDPAQGDFVRDGQFFLLDGNRFEFDTGSVLVVTAPDGSGIQDGDTFAITTNQATPVTHRFEFDSNNSVAANNIAVRFSTNFTQAQLVAAAVNAINAVDPAVLSATAVGNRISLQGDRSATESSNGLRIDGARGPSGPTATLINAEEFFNRNEFVNAVTTDVNAAAFPFVVGADGDRMNFLNATTGDFGQVPVFTDLGTNGGVASGNTRVGFLAQDNAATIARSAASAINSTGVTAQARGETVQLSSPAIFDSAQSPLVIAGSAPGGSVTGLATLNGELWAVSDTGGLFRIISPFGNPLTDYINTATDLLVGDNGNPIQFAGLAAGPREVENGRYADMLFGIDTNGKMYAFDTQGQLQPIFVDGAKSVDTGVGFATGLAFSTLDRNLWHITSNRDTDVGHGQNNVFDGSRRARPTVGNGGSSFYFGNERFGAGNKSLSGTNFNVRIRDYNFPGGAHGSIESKTFSLKGYSAEDQPMLYFNYFLDTENTDYNPFPDPDVLMRDSFRVFATDDSGEWTLLGTNNSFQHKERFDEFDIGPDDTFCEFPTGRFEPCAQELYDDTGNWRQARIPLGRFAGSDNVRLRFDFASAGSFDVGNPNTSGQELRAVVASKLRDGQTFQLDFSDTFELNMGSTLVAPTGAAITDGSTFTIDNGVDPPATFQFDSGNGVSDPSHTPVVFDSTMTSGDVARNIAAAVRTVFAPTPLTASLTDEPNETLSTAVNSGLTGASATFQSSGFIGSSDVDMVRIDLKQGDQVNVDLRAQRSGSSLNGVLRLFDATGQQLQVNDDFNGQDPFVHFTAPVDGTYFVGVSGFGNFNYDPTNAATGSAGSTGSYGLTIEVNEVTPYTIGNRVNLDGARTVTATGMAAGFVEGNSSVSPNATAVYLHAGMSQQQVASSIATALGQRYAGGNSTVMKKNNELVRVIGHRVTNQSLGQFGQVRLGLETSLAGDSFGAFETSGPPQSTRYPGSLRGMDNAHEGVYIDDLIIGFAERGEMVTGANANTSFVPNRELLNPNLPLPHREILVGEYQLEIRRGADFGTTVIPPLPIQILNRSFDTNDRLAEAVSIEAPAAHDIRDGQTFTLSDGVDTLTFEFDELGAAAGVTAGNVAVPFNSSMTDFQLARSIRDTINSPAVQGVLDVTAATSDGNATGSSSTSNRIDLFGNVIFQAPTAASLGVTGEIREGRTLFNDEIFRFVNDSNSGEEITRLTVELPDGLQFRTFGGFFQPEVSANSDATGESFSVVDGSSLLTADFTHFEVGEQFVFGAFVTSAGFFFADGSDLIGSTVTVTYDSGRRVRAVMTDDGVAGNGIAAILTPPTVSQVVHDDSGDRNTFRDQGQVIINANRITNSSEYGIVVDAGPRTSPNIVPLAGSRPHPGAARNLRELNREHLAPGVTVVNNVLANNGTGGIRFSGDNTAGEKAPVPVGRIINNTIVGTGSGIGIRVDQNASPTVLNNILARLGTGIDVDASSSSTVVGGMVYKGNTDDFTNATVGAGDFPIILADGSDTDSGDDPLFVDAGAGNFYLASGSKAIDSAINSLQDRPELVRVKDPLGIPRSPVLAPDRDITGTKRVDDPNAGSQAGSGENVFKDRGAIDRSDFTGPAAVLINPRDNDAAGSDEDNRNSFVQISATLNEFSVKLVDGASPLDPIGGSGIDDRTVRADTVTLRRNGVLLTRGVDYSFNYDATDNVIRLLPLAGIWNANSTYTIELANQSSFVIAAPEGSSLADGNTFTVTDRNNNQVTLELESGYTVQVPQTFALQVPTDENGKLLVADGERLVVSNGTRTVTFELDSNGVVATGNVALPFTASTTSGELADALVARLQSAQLGLSPRNLGGGRVHLGSATEHTVDTSNTMLVLSGQAGGVAEGQQFAIDDGTKVVTFEFDTNGSVSSGNVPVAFTRSQTNEEIAATLASVIRSAGVGLTPTALSGGELHVGGTVNHVLQLGTSSLTATGQPGVNPAFGLRLPTLGGKLSGLTDGETFVVSNGTRSVTFELDSNNVVTPGNTVINFTTATTVRELADAVILAIRGASLGLSPVHLGNGRIRLGGNANHSLTLTDSSFVQLGQPGVPASIPVVFEPTDTAAEVAASINAAINASGLAGVSATVRENRVVVLGASDITGIENIVIGSIRDIAANTLKPNRTDGTTQFEIVLTSGMDYGDAPDSYNTLDASAGPHHQILAGFTLGSQIDSDADGQPSAGADGDDTGGVDDEDGVTFSPLRIGFGSTITVSATGITAVGSGKLDAWIDFNGDGDFADAGERIFSNEPLVEGDNILTLAKIPAGSKVGPTYARFRLSSQGGLLSTGFAADGEVEDYRVTILGNPWQNSPEPKDVNDDNFVSPIDALLVVNDLNFGPTVLQPPTGPTPPPPPFLDVNGDGTVSPIDALLVINCLNDPQCPKAVANPEAEAEGEPLAYGDGAQLMPLGTSNEAAGGQSLLYTQLATLDLSSYGSQNDSRAGRVYDQLITVAQPFEAEFEVVPVAEQTADNEPLAELNLDSLGDLELDSLLDDSLLDDIVTDVDRAQRRDRLDAVLSDWL